jgi:hypothetical protein
VFEYFQKQLVHFTTNEQTGETPCALTNWAFSSRFSPVQRGQELTRSHPSDESGLTVKRQAQTVTIDYRNGWLGQMVEQFPEEALGDHIAEVAVLYSMLRQVSRSPAWQIVYELANGQVHFRTRGGSGRLHRISFGDFNQRGDLDCRQAVGTGTVLDAVAQRLPATLRYDLNSPQRRTAKLDRSAFTQEEVSWKLLSEARAMLAGAGVAQHTVLAINDYGRYYVQCVP